MYFKRLLPFGFQHIKCRNLKISGGYFSKVFSKEYGQRSKFPDVGRGQQAVHNEFHSFSDEASKSRAGVKPLSSQPPSIPVFPGNLMFKCSLGCRC